VPAAVALVVIAEPLVSVLFERGRFTPEDTANTALACAIYGAGLPAFVLQKVLQPLYFARSDTVSPFRFALWAMLVNAASAIGLAPVIGWPAAALGTTLAGWAMVVLLWRGARGMGAVARFDARFAMRVPRQVLAALAMGAALWAGAATLDAALHTAGLRYLALAALVGGGAILYFGLSHVTGALPLGDLRVAFRRRGGAASPPAGLE